ncbi:MAG: helix-turn-helix domain-containing protein [Gammaproteobacteria bacterium]|nr:helix-turn-helix domain-containing protein [Gammaproteobacteria bacterium]MDH5801513.1 helix-turn-helix domain-containing protein [Gammaproteobacteria bacterium]
MTIEQNCATYSVTEAAKILGIGKNQAYEGVKRGEIPHITIGTRILVPKDALHKKLAGCKG